MGAMTYTAWFFGGPLNGLLYELPEKRAVVQVSGPSHQRVLVDCEPADDEDDQESVETYTLQKYRCADSMWELFVFDSDSDRIHGLVPEFVVLDSRLGAHVDRDSLAAAIAAGRQPRARLNCDSLRDELRP